LRDKGTVETAIGISLLLFVAGYFVSPASPEYVPKQPSKFGNLDINLGMGVDGTTVPTTVTIGVDTTGSTFTMGTPLLTYVQVGFNGLNASNLGQNKITLTKVIFYIDNTELPPPSLEPGPIAVPLKWNGNTWIGNKTVEYLQVAEWAGNLTFQGSTADGVPIGTSLHVTLPSLTIAPGTGPIPAPLSDWDISVVLWVIASIFLILAVGFAFSKKNRSR